MIFILQLVGLVLTYSFRDCHFEGIRKDYQNIIFTLLNSYINKTTCNRCNIDSCESRPDCLTKIERLTFYPTPGCKSLAESRLAAATNATLAQECPGYSGAQINNTRAMKNIKNREDTKHACLEVASNLRGLWGRFTRF